MVRATAANARTRRRRGSINRDDILAGAFEVARGTTLDQLSMPVLAAHLDVGVTSLYWYFRKKDELLDAMTEIAVAGYVAALPSVRDDQSWQEVLAEHFRVSRDLHSHDHVLSDLLLTRPATFTRDNARRVFQGVEAVIVKLVDAGFTPDNAYLAFTAASVFTRGMTMHDRILRLSGADMNRDPRSLTDWSSMPVLESMLDRHALTGTTDENFEFGLARLIAGFSALLVEQEADQAGRRTGGGTGRANRVAPDAVEKPIKKARPVKRAAAGKSESKTLAKPTEEPKAPKKPARATKADQRRPARSTG